MTNITKVGIGVALFRYAENGVQVLMGKRKGSHGEGEWALPGGGMEYLESFDAVARRELSEEIGDDLQYEGFDVVSVLNLIEYAPKHYIDIAMLGWYKSGEAKVTEPDKCEGWKWFYLNELPSPRFATVDRIIDAALAFPFEGTQVYDA